MASASCGRGEISDDELETFRPTPLPCHHQTVYVHRVPWSEFSIVPSYTQCHGRSFPSSSSAVTTHSAAAERPGDNLLKVPEAGERSLMTSWRPSVQHLCPPTTPPPPPTAPPSDLVQFYLHTLMIYKFGFNRITTRFL